MSRSDWITVSVGGAAILVASLNTYAAYLALGMAQQGKFMATFFMVANLAGVILLAIAVTRNLREASRAKARQVELPIVKPKVLSPIEIGIFNDTRSTFNGLAWRQRIALKIKCDQTRVEIAGLVQILGDMGFENPNGQILIPLERTNLITCHGSTLMPNAALAAMIEDLLTTARINY